MADVYIEVSQRKRSRDVLVIQSVWPRFTPRRSVKSMNAYICWSCLLWALLNVCRATSIVIRSDGRQIAVTVDSKRLEDPNPVCKMRGIPGGVFVAAGLTQYHIGMNNMGIAPKVFYEVFDTGPAAANGLDDPEKMISRFSELRDNSKLTSQIRCNGVVPFR